MDFESITEECGGVVGGQMTTGVKTIADRRKAVMTLIDHNLERLADPTYTIKGPKSEKAPDKLYELRGDKAVVCLRFNRVPLKLNADGATTMTIPAEQVPAWLRKAREIVAKGGADDTINEISEKASERLAKARKLRKPETKPQAAADHSDDDAAINAGLAG